MRKTALLAMMSGFLFLASFAQAQQADAMLGFGTIVSTSSGTCAVFSSTCVGRETGGLFTNISADVIFHKRIGVAFDASWRTKQGVNDNEQLYRPILFDFNADYQPRLSKKIGLDLLGGVGWQTTRFYGFQYTTSCLDFNACYTSNNHFLVDAGAGLRYYAYGNIFIRPEVHFYHILNNTDVFTNNNVIRVGASIGYTIGGPE